MGDLGNIRPILCTWLLCLTLHIILSAKSPNPTKPILVFKYALERTPFEAPSYWWRCPWAPKWVYRIIDTCICLSTFALFLFLVRKATHFSYRLIGVRRAKLYQRTATTATDRGAYRRNKRSFNASQKFSLLKSLGQGKRKYRKEPSSQSPSTWSWSCEASIRIHIRKSCIYLHRIYICTCSKESANVFAIRCSWLQRVLYYSDSVAS